MSESLPLLTAYAERPDNLFALLYRYRVVVPAFQRQYVQGADGPKAKEVRENFIRSLLDASRPAGGKLHLHFIYGPIDTEGEDAFTPVDGQQRLTTLWLLARYAVERLAPEADGDRKGVLKLLARFSYAGRRHAERFCQALTTEGNGWNLKNSPDQSIPLQPWFWPAWKEDETVDSMLRMLDAIHAHWAESDPRNVLEALHTDITFSLQIDSFADDIYMKMNARGLQLTQWENLKGRFAELLAASPLRQDWLGNFRSPSEQDKRLEDKAGTCQRIVDQLTQSTDPISPRQVWRQVIEVLSNCYFCKAKSQMKQSDGQVDASRGWLPDDAFLALMARLLALQLRIGKDEAPEDSRDVPEPKDVPEDLVSSYFNSSKFFGAFSV